jgi:hypothetical protein
MLSVNWGKFRSRAAPQATPKRERPVPEDFTPQAIQRAVLAETLQHPATILPWAGATVAGVWTLLMGATPESVIALMSGLFAGAAAWVVNFYIRGDARARVHVEKLRSLRREFDVESLEELEATCLQARFKQGAKEAAELKAAYLKFGEFLSNKAKRSDDLQSQRLSVLAEDTYREGRAILAKALQVFVALNSVNVGTLRRERDELQDNLKTCKKSQVESLEQQLEVQQKRIELYERQETLLSQLLTEANELEAALETAYLEVVELVAQDAELTSWQSGAGTRLERAVEGARRAEEKLRGLTNGTSAEDEMYLNVSNSKQKET